MTVETRIIRIQKELVEHFQPPKVLLLKDKATGVAKQVECIGKAKRYWVCKTKWDYECYEFDKYEEVQFNDTP